MIAQKMSKRYLNKKMISFKNRVLLVVKEIKRGKTMSYKEVATVAGSSGAYRCVGTIMSKNKDKDVPCHRVIKSDGRAGGYNTGGSIKKIKCLQSEGIKIYK